MSESGSLYMYILGDIVVVYCISLCELDSKPQPTRLGTDSYFSLVGKTTLRGVSVNEFYFYYCILLYLGVRYYIVCVCVCTLESKLAVRLGS